MRSQRNRKRHAGGGSRRRLTGCARRMSLNIAPLAHRGMPRPPPSSGIPTREHPPFDEREHRTMRATRLKPQENKARLIPSMRNCMAF